MKNSGVHSPLRIFFSPLFARSVVFYLVVQLSTKNEDRIATLSTYCLFRVIQTKWHGKLKGQPYSGRSFTNFTSRCNISLPNWWLHFQSRCTWWLLFSLISWQWAVDVTNSTYFAGQWAMRSSCFCFPKRKAEEEKQQWSLIHAVNQGQWLQTPGW